MEQGTPYNLNSIRLICLIDLLKETNSIKVFKETLNELHTNELLNTTKYNNIKQLKNNILNTHNKHLDNISKYKKAIDELTTKRNKLLEEYNEKIQIRAIDGTVLAFRCEYLKKWFLIEDKNDKGNISKIGTEFKEREIKIYKLNNIKLIKQINDLRLKQGSTKKEIKKQLTNKGFLIL